MLTLIQQILMNESAAPLLPAECDFRTRLDPVLVLLFVFHSCAAHQFCAPFISGSAILRIVFLTVVDE